MTVRSWKVEDDGNLTEVSSFSGEDKEVYIVAIESIRKLFLWKGNSSPIRRKFIGSRSMNDLRKTEYGFHYNVVVVEQGDEPDEFRRGVGGDVLSSAPSTSAEVSSVNPRDMAQEQDVVKQLSSSGVTSHHPSRYSPPPSSSDLQDQTGVDIKAPSGMQKMGAPGRRPTATILTQMEMLSKDDVSTEDVVKIEKQVTEAVRERNIEDSFKILRELGSPQGYTRDLVIVGSKAFREVSENNFEELDEPMDGVFMVHDFIPRIIAENGIVKIVELLKPTGEEIEDTALEQNIGDLVDLFGIDIDM
ncbi:MAG: hypothetical protein ACTSYA_11310 [Candidatus Kariarchaeaceae archaeon]